jgi:hypothetical protein
MLGVVTGWMCILTVVGLLYLVSTLLRAILVTKDARTSGANRSGDAPQK